MVLMQFVTGKPNFEIPQVLSGQCWTSCHTALKDLR